MSLKKLFFLSTVIFLIGQIDLYAQSEKVSLSGTIQDAKSGETLPFVVVNIKDLNLFQRRKKRRIYLNRFLPWVQRL